MVHYFSGVGHVPYSCSEHKPTVHQMPSRQKGASIHVASPVVPTFVDACQPQVSQFAQRSAMLQPVVVIDEADKFWTCTRGSTATSPNQREQQLARFGRMIRNAVPGPWPRGRYGSFWSLVQVTATPLDCLAWHWGEQVPCEVVFMNEQQLQGAGYVGASFMEPLKVSRRLGVVGVITWPV